MKITVLGTGSVGVVFAGRLMDLGYEVMIGTRNVTESLSRTTGDGYGGPPFSSWYDVHKQVKLGTFAEASAFGEVVINATRGGASVAALKLAGESNLNNKVLIDVANPLDFSKGMPPVLLPELCNTNSLGEEIQRTFPRVKVVKALNTMLCSLMVNPVMINGGDHNVFICGNDSDAKASVIELLKHFGWEMQNILDLGDITASRGTEMILPLWLRVMGTVGTAAFNFRIVK